MLCHDMVYNKQLFSIIDKKTEKTSTTSDMVRAVSKFNVGLDIFKRLSLSGDKTYKMWQCSVDSRYGMADTQII